MPSPVDAKVLAPFMNSAVDMTCVVDIKATSDVAPDVRKIVGQIAGAKIRLIVEFKWLTTLLIVIDCQCAKTLEHRLPDLVRHLWCVTIPIEGIRQLECLPVKTRDVQPRSEHLLKGRAWRALGPLAVGARQFRETRCSNINLHRIFQIQAGAWSVNSTVKPDSALRSIPGPAPGPG
jgi:hypothetical protein